MTLMQKCDRCGEIMEGELGDNEMHFTKRRNSAYGYDVSIHLCDKCLKDFEENWLKNKLETFSKH